MAPPDEKRTGGRDLVAPRRPSLGPCPFVVQIASEDDDEEDDDVSCATRFPLIFARILHHEPIPALPDVSNPPRIGRARVGAANSALRTAFTGVESSICYFLSSYEPRETARLLPCGTASLTARVSLRPPIDSAQGVEDEEDVLVDIQRRAPTTVGKVRASPQI